MATEAVDERGSVTLVDLYPTSRASQDATQGRLAGKVYVETVQSGSRKEPTYRMPGLYTSSPGAPSGPRLPREPEELHVEPLADEVVVAVEDRLPLLGAPTCHHVHRGGFDLRQVGLGARHTPQVLPETL